MVLKNSQNQKQQKTCVHLNNFKTEYYYKQKCDLKMNIFYLYLINYII